MGKTFLRFPTWSAVGEVESCWCRESDSMYHGELCRPPPTVLHCIEEIRHQGSVNE